MSAASILVCTALAVLFVLAAALLAGSLAILAGLGETAGNRGGSAKILPLLDRQWRLERLAYRHHRLFGGLVVLAGTFFLWQATRTELAELLGDHSTASVLLWCLLVGQGFNILVGLVVFFRPSLLKPLESVSNRWHDLDLARQHRLAPRTVAALLALVGLILLLGSTTLMARLIVPFLG
ncbi:MAG: hypothetical protein GVY32_00580 [Gammaproteobacteria bacterium]|jgi:hypothetical protein|nr:hypothetical protein [Gammaproteobacteria bacterium]